MKSALRVQRSALVGLGLFWVMDISVAFAAPPQVDPCGLLTKAEVGQIVGALKGEPTRATEGDAQWCNFEFANDEEAMEVWVFPADGIERARKKAKNLSPLKGVGEDAFLVRKLHGLDYLDLFMKKGNITVEISLKETAGDEGKVKALAQKALSPF